jgi:methionyl-tRNA formyltransferase
VLRQKRIPLAETPSLRKRDLEPLLDKLEIGPLYAIVVACFPWKVPRWLRVLPRFGALNVHPSLLPALRGPEPEFWALRLGLRETGVTVHLMDEGLDTGPILAQRPVLPEMTLPALEQTLATVGGELARDAVHALAAGEAQPWEQVGDPTYAPTPSSYDLTVPTDLPAGWAARFVRAVAPVYAPLTVLVMATGQRLPVVDVVGFEERATLPSPVELNGEIAAVRFSPGVARFRLAPGTSCQAG